MTQGELAARSGVSKKTIGRIENGRSSMQIEQMYRIAAALGVTLGGLLEKAYELGG
ncbi:helix-turn-helix transcriptional regulator [Paenibacillus sp. NPDC056722]|uniref:helix-turn-helix transcriptional regulator n=1 Tax=Paenibacillus sp. NPDC056722 TaxID=3345924 RepID=UPI003680D690